MAQHLLLSAGARTLSLKAIYQAGEDEAYETFCELRWPESNGSPQCLCCASTKAYHLSTCRRFKCAACHHQFSVTSGTIFACRKLSFFDLLTAICLYVNAAKGASALQLSRDLDVQFKTAFVLAQKLREALAVKTAKLRLSNTVEVDVPISVVMSARLTSKSTASIEVFPNIGRIRDVWLWRVVRTNAGPIVPPGIRR